MQPDNIENLDGCRSRCPGEAKTEMERFSNSVIEALRTAASQEDLASLMRAIGRDLGFQYYALIHHDDLSVARSDRVNIKHYPAAIAERLFVQRYYRRDPIIRGCIFADSAFLWSELDRIICLDKQDHATFELGKREGLNEGITVPCLRHDECMGSCTFAGCQQPERVGHYLGPMQMIGIFAFQAARRLLGNSAPVKKQPRLHPRPRDCVILLGRGLTNKQIARTLALSPKTVDGYLAEARKLFGVHGRTELVVSAVLAGEIGLHELKPRQPG